MLGTVQREVGIPIWEAWDMGGDSDPDVSWEPFDEHTSEQLKSA
jgi:hypothetical protein